MARSADGFFLPKNAQSTPPSNARLSGVNASGLHEEKTDYVCLGSRARKSLNHSNPVTAVTDSNNLTLVMCSYSAGSIFEFAISSSSGEIQVDSRPSLNRANLPGRTTELKELDVAENGSQHRAPSRTKTFGKYQVQQAQRPDSKFNI